WQYMQKTDKFTLQAAATIPNVAQFSDGRIKEVIRLTYVDSDSGKITPVSRVSEDEVVEIGTGLPSGYYLEGTNTFIFDSSPEVDMEFKLRYYKWTDIADNDAFESWILSNAPFLVIAETLLLMAALIRNKAVADLYIANLQ